MEYFTEDDFDSVIITNISYDEVNRVWTFLLDHEGETYYIKNFDLPHPDDIDESNIIFAVNQKLLVTEKKQKNVIVKKKFELKLTEILNKPLSNLIPVEYSKPDTSQILEYDGAGDTSFFVDFIITTKQNVNVLLDLNSNTWSFGKYNGDEDIFFKTDRLVNISGKNFKLTKNQDYRGRFIFEVVDEVYDRLLEYNGLGGKNFFMDTLGYFDFNINIILSTEKNQWFFGPKNTSRKWIDIGDRLVKINSQIISLSKINEDGFGSWYVVKDEAIKIIEINDIISYRYISDINQQSKYNVHMIFNIDTLTWEYGQDNVDYGWLGENKKITYESYEIDIFKDFTFSLV
jgi:hypothetical protein